MVDKWFPPPPDSSFTGRTLDDVPVYRTPETRDPPFDIIDSDKAVLVDPLHFCRHYKGQYRYVRLLSSDRIVADEPLYVAIHDTTVEGVIIRQHIAAERWSDDEQIAAWRGYGGAVQDGSGEQPPAPLSALHKNNTGDSKINIRSQPSLSGKVVDQLDVDGTVELVMITLWESDGYSWRQIAGTSTYIAVARGSTALLVPLPKDDPIPEPPPPVITLHTNIVGNVRIRSVPTTLGNTPLGVLQLNETVRLLMDKDWTADGYTWRRIADTDTYIAIARGSTPYLVPADSVPVPPPPPPEPPEAVLSPFTVSGNDIYLNGAKFRFVGCNIRELAYFGTGIMRWASEQALGEQLDAAREVGFRVVRFYAAHYQVGVDAAIPLNRRALDALQARGMFGLVCLTDHQHSGYNVAEPAINYTTGSGGGYTDAFYAGGYRDNYLPYVDKFTAALGNHPAVFAFEIGNELTMPRPVDFNNVPRQDILNFFRDASDTIRKNSNKLISTGSESSHHLFLQQQAYFEGWAKKLYDLPNINLTSIHAYQHPDSGAVYGWQQEHVIQELAIQGIPIIVGEMGADATRSDQVGWLREFMQTTGGRVSGFMPWGVMFGSDDIGTWGGGIRITRDGAGAWYHLHLAAYRLFTGGW